MLGTLIALQFLHMLISDCLSICDLSIDNFFMVDINNFFKILFFWLLAYIMYYCQLQSPCCVIEYYDLFLLSGYDIVPMD